MAEEKAKDKISEIFENKEIITQALARGVHEALLRHKQAGNPVAVRRDGKTIWLKPEEITEAA